LWQSRRGRETLSDIEVDPARSRVDHAWRSLGAGGFDQDRQFGDLYTESTRHDVTRVVASTGDTISGYAQAIVFREGPKLVGSLGIHATVRHGPILRRGAEPQLTRALAEGLIATLRSRVAYVRVYPGRGAVPAERLTSAGFKRTAWLNYYVDLPGSEDSILARVSKNRRYGIRKAAERGVTVRPAENKRDVAESYRLLAATHERVEFPLEPEAFFERAFAMYHPIRLEVLLAEHEGRPLATAILAVDGNSAVNWFAGSALNETTRKLYPNDAVLWEAIRWAKSRGLARFDMGGGGPPESLAGFVDFKRQFGGEEVDVGQYTFVPSEWKLAIAGKGFDLLRKIRGMRR